MGGTLGVDELAATPLFASVAPEALDHLALHGRVQRFRKGSTVFEFGDPPGGMFVVRRGRAEVVVPSSRAALQEVGPGGVFGELSLILDEPRTATVRAKTALTVWTIDRGAFAAAVAVHPDLGVALSREVSRRLVRTTRQMAPAGSTPLTAVWGDGTPVARAIAATGARVALARMKDAPEARRERGVTVIDAAGADEATVASWVSDGLPRVDHLVVSVGPVPVRVNRAALEQAAHVVVLDPRPPWFDRLDLRGRVVAAEPSERDLRRVARVVTGRAVGLALSSGGSKTVAHIGTVRAIDRHDVEVDFVAGSSGGALFAAAFAFGHQAADLLRFAREFAALSTLRRLDYARLPRSGLIRGIRIHDQLRVWFDGARLEDAPTPIRVVAADVATGAEVVLSSGDVADALRASMSIPGVFEPWSVDGRWLMDGAIVDPLPAAPLRAIGAGTIVASNVAGQENLRQAEDGKAPGILQIVGRVVNASERELLRNLESLVDVMVRPVVKASGPLDFSRIDEFVAAGEAAADEALAAASIALRR